MSITVNPFGTLPNGQESHLFTINLPTGESVALCDYGARIVNVIVPDRDGTLEDVVWGYEDVRPYCELEGNAGAVCGRVAARIEGAFFVLDGVRYELSKNEGENTLHGGFKAFDTVMWSGCAVGGDTVCFTYVSADGEEGFPGKMVVNVLYTFTEARELVLEYRATSDRDTVCSITNHTYFNLAGHGSGSVLNQRVQIMADFYCTNGKIPMADGGIAPVEGTPLDFRQPKAVGLGVDSDDPQIARYRGYNHTFALRKSERGACELAAVMEDDRTGRRMEVYTSMPGLHFFSANKTTPRIGKGGAVYDRQCGLCYETQFLPNPFKNVWFPSPVLRKERSYIQKTVYKFMVVS